jgi:hypothetical protein
VEILCEEYGTVVATMTAAVDALYEKCKRTDVNVDQILRNAKYADGSVYRIALSILNYPTEMQPLTG